MTRFLQDVLREHADTATTPHLDVDAIIGAGDRRVRRGRLTSGLAAASVAALVVGTGFVLPGLLTAAPGPDPAAAPEPFLERQVGYAQGDVIHWGSERFAVGRPVVSYVQTDDGFVFTTPRHEVWFFDGSTSRRIGHAGANRVRADDDGSLVAWVGADESGGTQYVVYDTRLGTEVARVDDAAAGPSREETDRAAEVFAVDDGSVYWRVDANQMVRYDVSSGDAEVLYEQAPPPDPADKQPVAYGIADVAAGQVAFLVDAGRGAETKVARGVDLDAPTVARATNVVLSPDGGYLGAEEDDAIKIYDVATRADVTPDLDRYPYAVSYGWVDMDTAMVLGIRDLEGPTYTVDLLSCDVPGGACSVVDTTEIDPDGSGFVLPVGTPMDT